MPTKIRNKRGRGTSETWFGFPYDDRLVCFVKALKYDFKTRIGVIVFPEMNCCDFGRLSGFVPGNRSRLP
jgi:hypothetical protein